ncbi:hypothetical protein LEN26_000133 [Aphanomyces euteiches]|nr:hypothetical protein AeMF1_011266 [Aphanomyces euteiches]KAH9164236.1 hypothetical protein LEN26_000133 [Aphanomyces euteiches]KAH9182459.1 hypothetical protein AeNC1_015565 [Aphanomyces euteiches]
MSNNKSTVPNASANSKMLDMTTMRANNKVDRSLKSNQADHHHLNHAANALGHIHPPNEATSADSGVSDASQAGGGTGSGTNNGTGRKYERRTKRFIWPDELHRLFVAAVFDVGLKNASPKALLTLMGTPACMSGLTTEHLKSHLQKYRLNYDRSRVEFLKFFDESVNESNKQQKRKGKVMPQGAVTSLFPIIPKRKRSSEDLDEASSDEDDGPDDKVSKVVAATTNITRQLDVQSKTLQMQAQFQEEIQQQLFEQAVLQRKLQEKLAEVTVRQGDSPLDNHLQQHPIAALAPTSLSRTTSFNSSTGAPAPQMSSRPSTTSLQDQLNQLAQFPMLSTGGFISPALTPGMDPTQQAPPPHGTSGFSLDQQNASRIQMQLALGMQQQMRLHQQMLQRKVEVSQSSTSAGASTTTTSVSGAASATTPASISPPAATNGSTRQQSFRHQLEADWPEHKDDDQATAAMAPSAADASMQEFAWDSIDVDMNDDLFGFLK